MKKYAVIMAGGSGTRFWPKSSSKKPKQLLALVDKKTQIQLTWDRLKSVVDAKNRWVITTENLAAATLKQIPGARLLKEPVGRNTMAAACWSAWATHQDNPDAVVALLPADAHVADSKSFQKALNTAFDLADQKNCIVCLGVKPRFAATGYGYIHAGDPLGSGFEIQRFVEKPDEHRAQEFFQSGAYYWNAGIFVFRAAVFINEVKNRAPEFATFFDQNIHKPAQLKARYKNLPQVSVDVALMEKTSRGALVPGDFGWNDIGSWPALREVLPPNSEAGLIRAPGGFEAIDAKNLIVEMASKKFVGLVGVSDLIVVETDKALLICHKDKAQKIKDLVALIGKNQKLRKELL